MVNDSAINQTLSRTLLTSFTVFLVIIVLYIFGGTAMRGLAFALLVGVTNGYLQLDLRGRSDLALAGREAPRARASATLSGQWSVGPLRGGLISPMRPIGPIRHIGPMGGNRH